MRRSALSRQRDTFIDSHIDRVTRSLHGLAYKSAQERDALLLKRKIYIGGVVTLLLGMVFIFISPRTTAETAMFYPSSCLGGWKNPMLATDKPDTESGDASFSDKNSAVLDSNISADIFCGGFKGDIPEHTSPSAVVVRLYMSYNGTSSTTTIQGENFASSTGAILDANASTSPIFQLNATSSVSSSDTLLPATSTQSSSASSSTDQSVEASSSSASSTSDIQNPPPQTTPDASSSSNSAPAPVSFLSRFFSHAYAVEIADVATDTASSSSVSDASSTDSAQSASSTDSASTTASTTPAQTQLFEILYTLDGKAWNSLGIINKNELQGAQFSIPLATSSTWVDIANIQIQVKRLSTFDDIPPVYLDGMSLEVTYAQQQEVQEDLSGDPKRYDVVIASSTGNIGTTVKENSDGTHFTVGAPNGGQLFIYSNADGQIKFSMGVGSDPVDVSSYQLDPGEYTAVMTNRENGCVGLGLEECISDQKTIGYSKFSIVPTRETPAKYLPTSLGGSIPDSH